MSAMTVQRRNENLGDPMFTIDHPAKATKVFYNGALVCLDSGGFLVPGDGTVPGLRVAGLVDLIDTAKLDTTGDTDGDHILKVQAGIWLFLNSASTDAIAQGDTYNACYLVDDQTVAKTDGGVARPIAGVVVKVTSAGVYVAVGFPYGADFAQRLPGAQGKASNLVTTGALGLTTDFTRLSITGTVALTLANGTFVGQKKFCRCTVAASTPAGTLTPASASGFTTISAIDAVGDFFGLEWNGTAWEVMFATGVTVA